MNRKVPAWLLLNAFSVGLGIAYELTSVTYGIEHNAWGLWATFFNALFVFIYVMSSKESK